MTTNSKNKPGAGASSEEVIIPARFHHVNLKAYTLKIARFYTALIGIILLPSPLPSRASGRYTFDAANHRVALMHCLILLRACPEARE